MQVIGITGGIGAGKSQVLQYIKQHYDCRIILADDVGNEVKLPGKNCYKQLVELLGNDILDVNGFIVKEKMAAKIFSDVSLLSKVNAVIHPAVQEYILTEIKKERLKQQYDFFFIEAALLIECGYSAIVDEMWYIYADEEVRRNRLLENRHYSNEKIDSIMQKQLREEDFRKNCSVVIDNSHDLKDTEKQIDRILGEKLWKM
ncbi:MAG: dephospho-CoA kinase [Lachnospiraceae bacterium]|nr:dephospho-CoA kinase [Lachnospiraceae bacterium]